MWLGYCCPLCTRAIAVEGGAALLSAMVREGGMGRYTRTALFASVPGAVTRLHYDHYDNLYVQLRGRKRFVLLAPLQARRAT